MPPDNHLPPFQPIPFNASQFRYFNPDSKQTFPGGPEISDDGLSCSLLTENGSGWYRTNEFDRRNGPIWGFWHDLKDDDNENVEVDGFEIRVGCEVKAQFQFNCLKNYNGYASRLTADHQFDQAVLFLYLDKDLWVKIGVEFVDDKIWDGVVVNDPYSDWSVLPHTHIVSTTKAIYTLTYNSTMNVVRAYVDDTLIREVNVFGYNRTSAKGKRVFVGIAGCSPLGGGVEARFEKMEIRDEVRSR